MHSGPSNTRDCIQVSWLQQEGRKLEREKQSVLPLLQSLSEEKKHIWLVCKESGTTRTSERKQKVSTHSNETVGMSHGDSP